MAARHALSGLLIRILPDDRHNVCFVDEGFYLSMSRFCVGMFQLAILDAQDDRSLVQAGFSCVFSMVPVTMMPGPYTSEACRAGISYACGLPAYKPSCLCCV